MRIISCIYAVFKREVKAILGDRLYLTTLAVLPVVMMLFFAFFFAHGTIDNLPIAVVDSDHSAMSRKLTSMIDATRGAKVIVSVNSAIEAQDLVLKGEVYGYVVIPDKFENSIVSSAPANVEVVISGANLSAAGVLRNTIQQAIMTLSSGIAISRLEADGASEYEVMADVMPINTLTHIVANPYINYGYYLAPMFMFVGVVVFTMLMTIYAIGREIRYGTAWRWLATASNSLFAALVGKLLPVTIMMMLVTGLILLILSSVMGMALGGNIIVLMLVSLLFILAYQAIAIAFVSITANLRLALSLGGGYSVMAFTFSGITFPTLAMYGIARGVSHIFPFTYYSDFFIRYTMMDVDIEYLYTDIATIMLFIFILALVWRRLSRVVRHRAYWGRD